MKNTIKLFVAMRSIAIIALAVIIGFTMTACPDGGNEITWEVAQVGGVPGTSGAAPTASTTAITITFSAAVSLTDADITIGGAAVRSADQLSHSGNVWTVPVTILHTDNATVKIEKDGVESGPKNVPVYKAGEVQAINWSAVADGEANITPSTKITITFSAAVPGLTANEITIHGGTGIASKGSLTPSGTENKVYDLAITVEAQGSVSVVIDKTGVSANPQQVQVYIEAFNPITDGLTTYINTMDQLVFNINGTYALNSPQSNGGEPTLTNGKYTWRSQATGTWTWDEGAQTITLTVNTARITGGTTLVNRTTAETSLTTSVTDQLTGLYNSTYDDTLEEYLGYGSSQEEAEEFAEEAALDAVKGWYDVDGETLEEVITASIAKELDVFETRSYTYIHSSDGESLILLDPLPTSVGSNELSGKIYFFDQDENHTFDFTDDTYVENIPADWWGTPASTKGGAYSYNATTLRVYLKTTSINNVTPVQYYNGINMEDVSNPYPDEAAYRTSTTHSWFRTTNNSYDPEAKTIKPRG